MLLSLLSNWALFLAKTLTLVVAIIGTTAAILGLVLRQRRNEEMLEITSLNEKYEGLAEGLAEEILSKKELKAFKKQQKIAYKEDEKKPLLYVLKFDGDMAATGLKAFREEISAIVNFHRPDDRVLLILESPGGMVHQYGLAAAQLERLKAAELHVTVAVDTIAASGGYLMAVVADHIVAAPFAVLGSIGVVAQLPNFHRFLDKHDIDIELHTAGKYKRTLTMFGENTKEGRAKFQEELDETQSLFKSFVTRYRPQLDMDTVATGEHWYGEEALKHLLVDSIGTSDAFIQSHLKTHQILMLTHTVPERLRTKLSHWLKMGMQALMTRFK
ncbi:MAG: protease SohB [Gammaproteobacteria bacterium]